MRLERILSATRADLSGRMKARPLDSFRSTLTPSDRPLAAALSRPRCGFILECKRASPSLGPIRPGADPAEVAATYGWAADAISVLTDPAFFGGSHDDLRRARAACGVPVLQKDFVVDPYQVYEGRDAGADAVLLMLSVLDDASYGECRAAADSLAMDVLTEVHDAEELARAIKLGAALIGVNSRDLDTMQIDRDAVERLAPAVPADRLVIAESGIRDHGDVRRLRPLVHGLLVGSALMGAPDLARAVRELVVGRLKVCGLTRAGDAVSAWEAGATLGGVVFVPTSTRCITLEQARAVCAASALRMVGVFADAPVPQIVEAARRCGLAAVQLHGAEDRARIARLRGEIPDGVEIWQARSPTDAPSSRGGLAVDRIVLDMSGGTGQAFDWSLLDRQPEPREMIVAGGITPENASDADALDAWALDVSSGVESAPGIKDRARLDRLAAALRGRGKEVRA